MIESLTTDPQALVRMSRRTGSWHEVGAWLAAALNDLDRSVRDGAVPRSERSRLLADHLSIAHGDQREIDLVLLPDGTRVCWHLSRSAAEWVVEQRGERCLFPV